MFQDFMECFSFYFYRSGHAESMTPPGRHSYLDHQHRKYRPTTDSDKHHKNLVLRKRRLKEKNRRRRNKHGK